MITGAWSHFWTATALWLAILATLELIRRSRVNPLAWWIVHGPAIAWGAVALIPWFIALRSNLWLVPVPFASVPLTLPATYVFTLLALIGLSMAVVPLALSGQPLTFQDTGPRGPAEISAVRVFIAIAVLLSIYVASRPSLSRIWVLSGTPGENFYSNTTNASSSFLGLSSYWIPCQPAAAQQARRRPLSGFARLGLWIGSPRSCDDPGAVVPDVAESASACRWIVTSQARLYLSGLFSSMACRLQRPRAAQCLSVRRPCVHACCVYAENPFITRRNGIGRISP